MKIFHVNINNYGGGVEQYLHQLFIELNKKGHKNIFLYGEEFGNITNLSNVKSFFIENITHLRCNNLPKKLDIVQNIIEKHQPNLVYIHQVLNSTLIDFLTQKLPSIRFVHGYKMVCPEGTKILKGAQTFCEYSLNFTCQMHAYSYRCMPRNLFKGLWLIYNSKRISQIHKRRSYIVVASNFVKSVLLKNGFKEKMIKVIPYFTHLPKINNDSFMLNKKKILALGRLVKAKGMHHLISTLSVIDENVQLDIVGDGPETPALKNMVKQRGLTSRVNFYGWLPHEKIEKIYENSSIVVIPSVWPEPFGIVGIEAMAHGKPIVAFDSGGISEWLSNGKTGFLVQIGDTEMLATKIMTLLNDPELGRIMGKNGRKFVKNRFLPETHLKLLLPLIENVVHNRNHLNSYQ